MSKRLDHRNIREGNENHITEAALPKRWPNELFWPSAVRAGEIADWNLPHFCMNFTCESEISLQINRHFYCSWESIVQLHFISILKVILEDNLHRESVLPQGKARDAFNICPLHITVTDTYFLGSFWEEVATLGLPRGVLLRCERTVPFATFPSEIHPHS